MNGDPVIQYQVYRDVLDSDKDTIDRAKIEMEIEDGWYLELMSYQGENLTWGDRQPDEPWKGSLWTLDLLRRFSAPRDNTNCKEAVKVLCEKGLQRDGGVNYDKTKGRSEVCQTGILLSLLCYFREQPNYREPILEFIIESEMDDGGWNCRYLDDEATHSSFHTTLAVLSGLRDYLAIDKTHAGTIQDLINRGNEFLLKHLLFRSHNTYFVASREILHFSFPPFMNYDVLTALDYFQSINYRYDNRFKDAIHLVKAKEEMGIWDQEHEHLGDYWFKMEIEHQESRWNTLRALRVLKWWNRVSKFKSL